jgi:hypothetical protein
MGIPKPLETFSLHKHPPALKLDNTLIKVYLQIVVYLCFSVNWCIFGRIRHPSFVVFILEFDCKLSVELQETPVSSFVFKMAQVEELLELLNTLILSFVDNTVTIDKTTLQFVVTCLQVSQAKAALLQTQTRLLHNALERKNL